ncbi:hypothetical protein U1Q18_013146 [Sarracenia purpurea var. burkii]
MLFVSNPLAVVVGSVGLGRPHCWFSEAMRLFLLGLAWFATLVLKLCFAACFSVMDCSFWFSTSTMVLLFNAGLCFYCGSFSYFSGIGAFLFLLVLWVSILLSRIVMEFLALGALVCGDGFCVLYGAGDCLVCWELFSFRKLLGFALSCCFALVVLGQVVVEFVVMVFR